MEAFVTEMLGPGCCEMERRLSITSWCLSFSDAGADDDDSDDGGTGGDSDSKPACPNSMA